jgi:hypothetical protein
MVPNSVERRYFLSASIPDPRREPAYYETADLTAIREAIMALATVTLKKDHLVFGGHPAISPMVLMVARVFDALDRVHIFQSQYFRDRISPENRQFPRIVWTPPVGDDSTQSLREMRTHMIDSGAFAGGFFVGGMEGVEEEFQMFRSRWPQTPVFPVASTGAAARRLLDRWQPHLKGLSMQQAQELRSDMVYGSLFERMLR